MPRPTRHAAFLLAATALLAAAVACLAPPAAWADERVIGPGYAFDLPGRFQAIPSPWQVAARAMGETVVQTLPRPSHGPVQMAFYTVPGPSLPEATLLVCRFELREDQGVPSVRDLGLDAVRTAYQHAVDTLPGASLLDCREMEFAPGVPSVYATIRYPHPDAGPRHVQSLVAVRGTTGVVLTADAPVALSIEYQAYFTELAGTLRLFERTPTLEEQLRVPALVVVATLTLLLLLMIARRKLRTRRARKSTLPVRILSCSPDFDTLGAVGPGSAESAAIPASAPAAEAAADSVGGAPPAEPPAPGSTREAEGLPAAPPVPERPPARREAPRARERVLPTAEPPGRPAGLKISRNTDFLSG